MDARRRQLIGALLLLALGLAAVSVAVLGERRDSWWVSAFFGLVVVGSSLKWLRDVRAGGATK